MQVALLTSANGWRGSGSSYAKLARGLGERGHVAHLVTAAPRLTSRLAAMELPVTEIPGRNTGPREVWALLRVLRQIEADAIVVDTPRDVRLAAWATLLHPARIVYRYNLNYRPPRNDLMDRAYLRRVAACVYQSRYIQEDAVQAPWIARIRGFRIPNGYDLERYAPDPSAGRSFRERYGIRNDTPVVLTTAKLTRNKGHEVAITALGRLHHAGTPLIYLVCGDGGREAELRDHARAVRLPAVFTGLLEPAEIVSALAAADVVVHPSLNEIFPNAVGEAMACGRAVIAADAGGTGELVGREGDAGVLVPPGDADALAAAVAELLADPGRRGRLGEAARRRIATEFPLARMIDRYEAALLAVIE
ncbi:MAG: glycosyltransferase family 4 protein [Gemmatimonadales bacterium]